MSYFQQPLSEMIWDIKYRYNAEDTLENTWLRVSTAIAMAEVEKAQSAWQKKFYSILENFQFLPGGRILAGAGTDRDVTLFNCFVMPVQDSLTRIFDALKEAALTLQTGGGVGYDFSPLRPAGFAVQHAGTISSGPVSFMHVWNAMCATMLSTGARRGAMMGILRCDHPDIEAFIQAKSNPLELRHFNVSVLVTDEFMDAVKNNKPWDLVFNVEGVRHLVKQVDARMLWEKIMRAAYDYAEPGVVFADTINDQNTLWYRETISATNPCGEIPLPAYGACNLGALNLTQFVTAPFTTKATIAWDRLKETAAIATRFLDNVISVSRYPLLAQKEQAYGSRRIGLGITGLADMFVMLGIHYGSEESLRVAAEIMREIAYVTWQCSIDLAEERGIFPFFDKEKYLQGEFVQRLPVELQKNIARFGVRNSHHNTIAPTGTISLLANNVSNGIEPIFSGEYERTVRLSDGELKKFVVIDYALKCWRKDAPNSLPPSWVDTQALLPKQHLFMQAAMQPFIDNAISKTINIPENFPFANLSEVYMQAYDLGLKGCTVFRPNPITGSVLTMTDETDRCCQI